MPVGGRESVPHPATGRCEGFWLGPACGVDPSPVVTVIKSDSCTVKGRQGERVPSGPAPATVTDRWPAVEQQDLGNWFAGDT